MAEDMLGTAGEDGNGRSGSCRLWPALEEKEQKSEVLWGLRGERLRIRKSKGSSLLPQL